MGEPAANGIMPSSQFITHITSYPLVSDSIATIKNSTYGQKSLELAGLGYTHLEPMLSTYLSKPIHIVTPYVVKADSLGDEGLRRVDTTVPKVIRTTEEVKGTVRNYILLPVHAAESHTKYILDTYNAECEKARGGSGDKGIVVQGKAAVSTGLMLTSGYLLWLSQLLVPGAKSQEQNVNGAHEAQPNGCERRN